MTSERRVALDGIRGWAAIAVAGYHCVLPPGGKDILRLPFFEIHGLHDLATKLTVTVFNGAVAVMLFFMLSGCVLTASLQRSKASPLATSVTFAVRRLIRIYPLVASAVVSFVGIFSVLHWQWPQHFGSYDLGSIARNVALYDSNILGATWSLQAEVLGVPFLAGTFLLSRLIGPAAYLLALCLGVGVYYGGFGDMGTLRETLLYFSLGMLVPTVFGRLSFFALGSWIWPIALLGTILPRQILGLDSQYGAWAHMIAGTLFVNLVYHSPPAKLKAFLESDVSQKLGRLSFSFYLFNLPVVAIADVIQRDFPQYRDPITWGLLATALTVIYGLAIAALTYRWIETPAIEAARMFRWPDPRIRETSSGVDREPVGAGAVSSDEPPEPELGRVRNNAVYG